MTDTVDRIVIESTTAGVDETTTQVKSLSGAMDGVTESSSTLEKSGVSLESKFASLERRFGTTQGQASQFEKIQSQVNLAVAQNPALQDRANEVLAAAESRFSAAGSAAKGAASELGHVDEIAAILESRMVGLGNSLGLIGQVLQVVGPGGLAAAAGLGAIVVGIDQVVGSANRMSEVATKLYEISSSTDVATDSVQALATAGVEFGLSTDQTGRFLERFAVQLDGAHQGTGKLYDDLQKINPELASQISASTSTAQALGILATAYKSAEDASRGLALATAAGAQRGTVGMVAGLLGSIADKGGVDAVTEEVNKLDLITAKQVDTWRLLGAQISEASEKAHNNIASIFTGPVLEAELSYYQNLLAISETLKTIGISDGLNRLNIPSSLGPGAPVPINGTQPFDIQPINGYGNESWNTTNSAGSLLGMFDKGGSYTSPGKTGQAAQPAPFTGGTGALGGVSDPVGLDSATKSMEAEKAASDALILTIGDQITKQKELVSALGSAADASQKLELKQLELQQAYEGKKFGDVGSPDAMAGAAAAQDQLNIDNQIAQAQDRQKEAAAAIAATWGGASAKTALIAQSESEKKPADAKIINLDQLRKGTARDVSGYNSKAA